MALTTTTLAAACGVNDTTIRVTSAAGFVPQQLIQIDGEMLAQSGAGSSGTTISVRRGVEGTVPAAHVRSATVATGTGADFAAPPAGMTSAPPSSGQGLVRQAVVTLSDAQIKTLPTTGTVVIPALGPMLAAFPTHVVCDFQRTAVYSHSANTSWALWQSSGGLARSAIKPMDTILNNVIYRIFDIPCPYLKTDSVNFGAHVVGDDAFREFSDAIEGVNEDLYLADWVTGVPAYTGGAATNRLTVSLHYLVYDIVQKRFV